LLGHHIQDSIKSEVEDIIFGILIAGLLPILRESKSNIIASILKL